jgi:hypothetical protein
MTFLFVVLSYAPKVLADSFGSGPNAFDIEFVTIGNPGNPADTTGIPNPAGSVDYAFRIGKFEISEDVINKANAQSVIDENPLYITHDNRGANKPATSISWFEAIRFINWLNTSKDYSPAYKFDGEGNFQLWQSGDAGYNPANPFRNSRAFYFLPSADEWYKAAYYDPTAGVYYDYPTGSDTVPDGIDFPGDTTFDAVFGDGGIFSSNQHPNDITDVGILSPYGTAGQGGNVFEWQETEVHVQSNPGTPYRFIRGGSWTFYPVPNLSSSVPGFDTPSSERYAAGFRVARIPEPRTVLLAAMATIFMWLRRRDGIRPTTASDSFDSQGAQTTLRRGLVSASVSRAL